jgi:hypothetical protein
MNIKNTIVISSILLCFSITFLWSEESGLPNVPPRGGEGFVYVETTPSNALVYLDGDELGRTPTDTIKFRSGRFDFTVMYKGEELINERVNIWPGKITRLIKTLTMPYGTVVITTNPSSANIQVDGADVGRTEGGPLTINNVAAGTHILKIYRKGWRSSEVEISIEGEDTVRADIKLQK